MSRLIEKEIMDDPEQCLQYLKFNKINLIDFFYNKINHHFKDNQLTIFSFGSGTCEYESKIASSQNLVSIDAYEASREMNKLAKAVISLNNVEDKINLKEVLIEENTEIEKKYNFFICVNTLHQLQNPTVLWNTLKKACLPNSKFFILDLLREEDDLKIDQIIEIHAKDAGELFKGDFRASLKAAFTKEEIIEQLSNSGIEASVETINAKNSELKIIFIEGQYGI
jgi:2-polyprenyl-3-methyl-5-hydroxy-6-metoxy-1,4-benzoquinol methylase